VKLQVTSAALSRVKKWRQRRLVVQRLLEMKAMNAERTRGERDKKERRRQEKEAARLQQQ